MVVVSAVIPTRGRPELLQRAVRSALAQTLREIEVVVVIDGEDPLTRLALQELEQLDRRLRVVGLAARVGGSDARNRGVDAAFGNGLRFSMMTMNGFPGSCRPNSRRCGHRWRRL
jgi:glycosyltransferase involved in cell wall biosynthesis